MQIAILCTEVQKQELLNGGLPTEVQIIWMNAVADYEQHREADAFIDLMFEYTKERIALLKQLLPSPVIINSVSHTLAETDSALVRINGWTTFLVAGLIEASCLNEEVKTKTEQVFALLGRRIEWVPDVAGFITPRVISMIINEAFFALSEGVSTKEEIDTAMKLGTNYPYGPFEWGARIGLQNICSLLKKLSSQQPRYIPCTLLVQEAEKAIEPGTVHSSG